MHLLNRNTKQWQKIDSDHHLHPFTDHKLLSTTASNKLIGPFSLNHTSSELTVPRKYPAKARAFNP